MAKKAKVWTGSEWVELAAAVTDLSGYPALATNQFGFRNKIINGDFRINQRGYVSAANLTSGSYGFDRWKSTFTNTTLTFTSAPQGQAVTINSGGSVEQVIERENMPAGTYVLSWTGTATGRVYNTGATPPSYAASPILVTIDGTANVEVEFTASGGTRTLQNVQLEAGNVASAFERRPIGTELALCQRYYWRSDDSQAYGAVMVGGIESATGAAMGCTNPVTMRIAPTLSFGAGLSFFSSTTGQRAFTPNMQRSSKTHAGIAITITGGGATNGQAAYLYNNPAANSYVEASAEL